jgi:cytochrome c oxidase subunit IV
MSNHLTEAQYKTQVTAVWRATAYLAILTLIEVFVALTFHGKWPKLVLNSFFVIMTLWKAYYIVAEFMHAKYEKRALVLSLGIPLSFLIWAVIAFCHDGMAWLKAIIAVTTE